MIHKGIERLCGDPIPLRKKDRGLWEYDICLLVFEESGSLCHHPTVVGQQKTACTEEVELAQSYLSMVRTKLDALHKRHRSVIQRIADLEETLCGA